jgi:hypothetical protein
VLDVLSTPIIININNFHENICPRFVKLSSIRNAAVSQISVTMKERSTPSGSDASHVNDRVSIVPMSILWETCPTAKRPAAASD